MDRRKNIEGYLAGKGAERLLWSGVTSFHTCPSPVNRTTPNIEISRKEEGGVTVTETFAPSGSLVRRFRGSHPIGYPVCTIAEARALYEVEEDTLIALDPSLLQDRDPLLYRISVNPTPLQRLLQFDMGLENFYTLFADEPEFMRELLALMMANYESECQLIAGLPVRSVRMVENTSTTMISPGLYRELSFRK